MRSLTFKEFLRIVDEDAEQDAVKLQGELAMIDTVIARKTAPELQRKQRITKMLALKQKEREVELKTKPDAEKQQGMAAAPGSSGASTPGQG